MSRRRELTDDEAASLCLGRFKHPWTLKVQVGGGAGRAPVNAFDSAWSNLGLAVERWRLVMPGKRVLIESTVSDLRYALPDDLGEVEKVVAYERRVEERMTGERK